MYGEDDEDLIPGDNDRLGEDLDVLIAPPNCADNMVRIPAQPGIIPVVTPPTLP